MIEKLRELEKAASPAPWGSTTVGSYDQRHAAAKAFLDVMATRVADAPDIQFSDMSYVRTGDDEQNVAIAGNGPRSSDNATLIAAARNALPLLLDVVEAAKHYIGAHDGLVNAATFPARDDLRTALAALDGAA